jgi:hypothetical protein
MKHSVHIAGYEPARNSLIANFVTNYLLEEGKADGQSLVDYVERKAAAYAYAYADTAPPFDVSQVIPTLADLQGRGIVVCEKGKTFYGPLNKPHNADELCDESQMTYGLWPIRQQPKTTPSTCTRL